MNTKNTKTAVIILLIAANIFFIYNIMRLKINTENIPSDMIDDAVGVLSRNGLAADKSRIPAKKPVYFIYEGAYSGTVQEDIIKSFSGVTEEKYDETVKMYVPAGISYAAGEYRFIFSDADYFSLSINAGEEPLEEIRPLPEGGMGKIESGAAKATEKTIGDFIKKYNKQDAKLGFEVIGLEEDKYIWIKQTVGGEPLDSHIAYIEIRDGEVKYFSGRWYFGELTIAAKKMPLLDSVNILFKSMEADKNIISGDRLWGMSAEYTVMAHEMESFYLVPSWRLEFESGLALSYNMVTGNKN